VAVYPFFSPPVETEREERGGDCSILESDAEDGGVELGAGERERDRSGVWPLREKVARLAVAFSNSFLPPLRSALSAILVEIDVATCETPSEVNGVADDDASLTKRLAGEVVCDNGLKREEDSTVGLECAPLSGNKLRTTKGEEFCC
jgi:hypothetical protein